MTSKTDFFIKKGMPIGLASACAVIVRDAIPYAKRHEYNEYHRGRLAALCIVTVGEYHEAYKYITNIKERMKFY